MSLNVERDRSFSPGEAGAWTVVRRHRNGSNVLFRGERDECVDYARGLVDDGRWRASNRDETPLETFRAVQRTRRQR